MAFAIKAEVRRVRANSFAFVAQKTMYGGKHVDTGDTIFVFASENEGGQGLIARGRVTAAEGVPKKRGIARQTPRVSVRVKRTGLSRRRLGAHRTQAIHQMERRSSRNRAQFQVLPPGHQQDRAHLRRSGRISQRFLLARKKDENVSVPVVAR